VRVHAIQTGTVQIHRRQHSGSGRGILRFANTLLDAEWTEPLPIYAWAIEHPEGLILVDTGERARAAQPGYFPSWHPYYRLALRLQVEPHQEVGPRLHALGLAPEDVRWVVLTHLHTDHTGGLGYFPGAEVLVTAREFATSQGAVGKLRGYLPQHFPRWLRPTLLDLRPWKDAPLDGGMPLTQAGDVRIVPTPGHTAGHLSVLVDEPEQTLFMAGDASYDEANLVTGTVDGVSGMGGGLGTAAETLRRIRAYAAVRPLVYLPAHDPGAAGRLAERRVVKLATPPPAKGAAA